MTNVLLVLVLVMQVINFMDQSDVKARFVNLHREMHTGFATIHAWMTRQEEEPPHGRH